MARKNMFGPGGMFEDAPPVNFRYAKSLRENMTTGEMALWLHLRKGIDGLKFRRQHPISFYIVDFYCHKVKLIVEVDGYIHNLPDEKRKDKIREKALETLGNTIIRFTNRQVLDNTVGLFKLISEKIKERLNMKIESESTKPVKE
jgi:very-short-patch-repair endonuclease